MRMQTNSTSKYLQLEHVTLHYLDYGGPGPQTLVFVHGGGANAHWFDFVGPALARSCRVLAVDLRGHGDSSWAEPPVYTFEAHMQDLRALFQAEHIATPLLIGHSMGGILLTQYTGTWPQEVGALLVCDSRPVYSDEAADLLQQMGQRPGREYPTLEEYVAHFRIRPDGLRAPQAVHHYIARSAARQLPSGMWMHKIDRRVYAQRTSTNTLPFWQRITCPALLLRAEHSSRLTPALLHNVQEVCPHLEWTDVAGAGHHLTLDQPEQTATLIRAFLQRHHYIQG
jgi:pimeloyl-ACP methyl ester carboxylesterase